MITSVQGATLSRVVLGYKVLFLLGLFGAPSDFSSQIVTWLILPVVICLSQRLSHACLSISNYTVKLRMAHYISYYLFDGSFTTG
jgi:hypothetical protein